MRSSRRRFQGTLLGILALSLVAIRIVSSSVPESGTQSRARAALVQANDDVSPHEPASADRVGGHAPHSAREGYDVTIHRPSGPPMIDVALRDGSGRTVPVACATCHELRDPDPTRRKTSDLKDFHRDLPFRHGDLTCFSCHAPPSYANLRLADGSSVVYEDVMDLCRQCHGVQARSYDHGAHGGMSGYWDLSRGPRVRNNCIDCHDPHTPAFPRMHPTFKPRDRRPVSNERHSESHE